MADDGWLDGARRRHDHRRPRRAARSPTARCSSTATASSGRCPRRTSRSLTVPTVIDATGRFVLPGLIDVHVHYFEWMGELFLAHGVTAVKDVGNDVEWIATASDEVASGSGARAAHLLHRQRPRRAAAAARPLHRARGRRDGAAGRCAARRAGRDRDQGAGAAARRAAPPDRRGGPPARAQGHRPPAGHRRPRRRRTPGSTGSSTPAASSRRRSTRGSRIDLDTLEARDIYAKYVAERKAYALINEHRAGELIDDARRPRRRPDPDDVGVVADGQRSARHVRRRGRASTPRIRRWPTCPTRRGRSGRRRSCTRSTIPTISPSCAPATARSRRSCVTTARPAARCSPAPTRTCRFRV